MNTEILDKTKAHFLETFEQSKTGYPFLPRHIASVEKCCNQILRTHLEADSEIVFLSAWLHDIGQNLSDPDKDHAVESEIEVRKFLSALNYPEERIARVAHCVRAHRCKDVQPATLEANKNKVPPLCLDNFFHSRRYVFLRHLLSVN